MIYEPVIRWIFSALCIAITAGVVYCFAGANGALAAAIGLSVLVVCDLAVWLWHKWRSRRRAA